MKVPKLNGSQIILQFECYHCIPNSHKQAKYNVIAVDRLHFRIPDEGSLQLTDETILQTVNGIWLLNIIKILWIYVIYNIVSVDRKFQGRLRRSLMTSLKRSSNQLKSKAIFSTSMCQRSKPQAKIIFVVAALFKSIWILCNLL